MTPISSKELVLKNFVNGQWVDSTTTEYLDIPNPATGELLATVPVSTKEDVELAIQAAKSAFVTWRKVPVPKRARILFKYQQLLSDNHEELAKLLVMENGKSYKEAHGEVLRGIECVEFAPGAPTLMMGETLSSISEDIDSEMFLHSIFCSSLFCGSTFPMMVPCWMFPIAIACGNTFVLKPSERTPMLANKLAELFADAGLPNGVFNIVHGAHDVVNTLIENPDVKAISFVGSQPVAKYVYEKTASQGKRVQALSGAKNHHIVMPDTDLEKAVQNVLSSSFGSAGQRCMACSAVVLVGHQETFVNALKQKADEMKVGYGMDEDVLLTPVIRQSHREKIIGLIAQAVKEGATLVRDGRLELDDHVDGTFLGATIFDKVTPEMTIAREELFAPVLSILHAKDLDEALEIVNKSKFGNSATIYTQDAKAVRQFREDAEPGMLGVNVGVPAPMAFFPFSGAKDSFYGDLHVNGKDGIQFFTRKKMITSRYM